MFTDLVASTELRASLGEALADRFSADHERLLAEVVERCGGRVVKGEGDGVMAAFEAASDAVQAAVEIQRAVAMQDRWGQLPRSLALRIGLGAGDVTFTVDDCKGMPVVEAARLAAAAATNEILCTSHPEWPDPSEAEALDMLAVLSQVAHTVDRAEKVD